MRLAPLVHLSQDDIRYKLAYLMQDVEAKIFGPDITPVPRATVMTCWHLAYRIVMNLFWAAVVFGGIVGFILVGGFVFLGLLYHSVEMRWILGGIIVLAIVMNLWEVTRMKKRLHILKRKCCPLYIVSV